MAKLSWNDQAMLIEQLEARIAELEGLLGESPKVWETIRSRAQEGDMQAARLWVDERRRLRAESASGERLTIDDFVVPAGTRVSG